MGPKFFSLLVRRRLRVHYRSIVPIEFHRLGRNGQCIVYVAVGGEKVINSALLVGHYAFVSSVYIFELENLALDCLGSPRR